MINAVIAGALALGLAALGVGGAGAALPPEAYLEARETAPNHVQLRMSVIKGPGFLKSYGSCAVRAEVITVFRGGFRPGDEVTVLVDCARANAEPPPGPQLWLPRDQLRKNGHLEAFLSDDAKPEVLRWQAFVINGPSPAPRCPVDGDAYVCLDG